MPDCFLSYAIADHELAIAVRQVLEGHDLEVFQAPASIPPGDDSLPSILEALRNSRFVVLLASDAACESHFVQQEIGAAAYGQKQLVPIVWNMPPERLPAFARQKQALDLRRAAGDETYEAICALSRRLRRTLNRERLIAGGVLLGLIWLCGRDDEAPKKRQHMAADS